MGTSRRRGACPICSRRNTVAVLRTIALSASAALFERYSCQKRSRLLRLTMVMMMMTLVRSASSASPALTGSQ
ncbi:hypothetical protein D9M68_967280 [compost metagenome]